MEPSIQYIQAVQFIELSSIVPQHRKRGYIEAKNGLNHNIKTGPLSGDKSIFLTYTTSFRIVTSSKSKFLSKNQTNGGDPAGGVVHQKRPRIRCRESGGPPAPQAQGGRGPGQDGRGLHPAVRLEIVAFGRAVPDPVSRRDKHGRGGVSPTEAQVVGCRDAPRPSASSAVGMFRDLIRLPFSSRPPQKRSFAAAPVAPPGGPGRDARQRNVGIDSRAIAFPFHVFRDKGFIAQGKKGVHRGKLHLLPAIVEKGLQDLDD